MVMAASFETEQALSAEQWNARVDLAALHRLYVKFGWTDLIYTHISSRVPGEPQHFYIKPDGLLFGEVTASNLLKVDYHGNVLEGDDKPNEAGRLIHLAIQQARPDIQVAAHTHSRAGAAVSAMKCGLMPLSQHSNMLLPTVCYHDYQDVTNAEDECEILARDLGDKFIMVMHNHGLLACGRTTAEAFYYLYFMEMACKIQVDVLASGQEPVIPPDHVIDGLYQTSGAPTGEPMGVRVWPAMLRMLDAEDSSYRD